MSETYDSDLFRGAAEYYVRYRPPYAREAIDHVISGFGLGADDRVLDLGCGPGTLTIPFSQVAGQVLAMDPDPGMLAEGRRQAAAAGVANIEWREAGSKELGQVAGPFKLVLMGQSFHWMDRDQVLRDLYGLIEDGGGIAAIAPGERRPQESWEAEAARVVRRYMGEQPWHPQRNREPRHEPALERSQFAITSYIEFPTHLTRDLDSIIGCLYSNSSSTRRLLAGRETAFEADIREAMLRLNPTGVFHETLETGVLVAMKR
ncbi:MAG TPA: class I SAM-dependent methyltransferase [Caulobacteraceae bacterium]